MNSIARLENNRGDCGNCLLSELFDTARSSIAYHIGKIFKEGELQRDTSVEIFDRSNGSASRPPQYYNLDVIISVGYRVKS